MGTLVGGGRRSREVPRPRRRHSSYSAPLEKEAYHFTGGIGPVRVGVRSAAEASLPLSLAVAAKAFPLFQQRGAEPAPIGRSRTPSGTSHRGVIVLSGMRAGSKETICALAQLSTQRSLLGAPRDSPVRWQNVAGRSRWDQGPEDFAQTAIRGLFAAPLPRQVADLSVVMIVGFLAAPHQAKMMISSSVHSATQPVESQVVRTI